MAETVEAARPTVSKAVSHGICRPCLDLQLDALRRTALPRGIWTARPAFAQALGA
jgi:hypothetical protein